ncbi:hypothetical protein COW46_00500 [Candidatus Gracilibacteria bacterium CG17_big_fil_post_rev_8_21_14_2_50_48_13]|nr:MAG: hypothetical protein COW46_00500 [Candidatus Gracilibacteria bacterium CG17_big_fil_post_rev_8_21_14_2_50_48_13]
MGFEITLAKIHLSPIILYWRSAKIFLLTLVVLTIPLAMAMLGLMPWLLSILLLLCITALSGVFIWTTKLLWEKSGLYITNRRVYIEVYRSPWETFSTDLYFHNMRDTAYSYHGFLGKIFKYGTLFARNGSESDAAQGLVVNHLPEPDIVRDYISYVTAIEAEKRINALKYEDFYVQRRPGQSIASKGEMDKKMLFLLRNMKGITGAELLTDADKDVLWMTEEERNLGVFETLMRKHVVVATHDDKLRPPAADIVVQRAGRVVFPGVPFPEIPQKDVVSCSPGIKAHEYLATRIKVVGSDATLLIGWN